jgi:multidrug efflux pump subunit AcrA (membrane-fusion protein)
MAIELPDADDRVDEAWREIDQCLGEITALAAQAASEQEFYAAAIDRLRWALAAQSAAAWWRDADGAWTMLTQTGEADAIDDPSRMRAIAQAAARRELMSVPAAGNTSPRMLAPVLVDGVVLSILEVGQRGDAPTSTLAGQERFLSAVADCAAEFHRNALLRQLRGREAWWRQYADLAARSADARDTTQTAMELANGARSLLEVERATIVAWTHGAARVLAVSGVDAIDARAEAMLAAEGLAAAVIRVNEPRWYPSERELSAPQVEDALSRHLDASPAKELAVLPLAISEAPPCGALVLERFSAKSSAQPWHDGWPHVARQCAAALDGALAWEAAPLGAWSRRLAMARRSGATKRYSKVLIGALSAAAVLVAFMFIPAEFRVSAPGELQPVGLRHVFSGLEGEVVEVFVRSGETVQKNQLLARLRSPKLDLETSRVLGELQTAQARLATLEAARLESRFATTEDPAKARQLTAEEEELRESVKSLVAQQRVLEEERKLLEVRSDIAGQVLTPWDELDALPARPIRTGQQLFTVADVNGPWELKLQVPDRLIGRVNEQYARTPKAQIVTFVTYTESGQERTATVEDIALRAETNDEGESTVAVYCAIPADQLHDPRPGATVQARIDCGRSALGYVWFHEAIDRVSAWWTLYL